MKLTTDRPVAQCRQFPEEAKDASVSECTWTLSALEALRNALINLRLTYLLTDTKHRAASLRQQSYLLYLVVVVVAGRADVYGLGVLRRS